jgi:RNA 2',3'-cyclic 3'-phosphodiesterase
VDSYRTFVAIELPRALRAKLIEHIEQLRRQLPDARAGWSREHNLHLTLKFLGNVAVSEIPKVSDAIARAVTNLKPFELTVGGCGVFPPNGRPNVLWIGVSASQNPTPDTVRRFSEHLIPNPQHPEFSRHPLLLLYSAIEDECANAGFPREQRTFHPHLTIARLRKHGDERRLAEAHQNLVFAPETFSVSEVVVFKSELLRQGSKHTAISCHELH